MGSVYRREVYHPLHLWMRLQHEGDFCCLYVVLGWLIREHNDNVHLESFVTSILSVLMQCCGHSLLLRFFSFFVLMRHS